MNTPLSKKTVASLLALAMAAAGLITAVGVANAGSSTEEVVIDTVIETDPGAPGGCLATGYVETDMVPNVARYRVLMRKILDADGNFNVADDIFIQFDDYNDPGTVPHTPATGRVAAPFIELAPSSGDCADAQAEFDMYVTIGPAVETFVQDPPPVAGPAYEVQSALINNQGDCLVHTFVTVPDFPAAQSYELDVFTDAVDPIFTRPPIMKEDFNPNVPANSFGLTAYDTPGRLGQFHYATTFLGRGCQWWEMVLTGDIVRIDMSVGLPNCFGQPGTIAALPGVKTVGTAGSDVIIGTAGPDEIVSRGGNDFICSLGGDDNVKSGGGDDKINLGGGDDVGVGGKGNDTIQGKKGSDRAVGGAGSDRLVGGGGADTLLGGKGPDFILGGPGNDSCKGGAGLNLFKSC